jgi:hypothetical protein
MTAMKGAGRVLTEGEAVELLAFLITSARALSSEPPDYGPMRLLSAAAKLSQQAGPRMDGYWQAVFLEIAGQIPLWLRERQRNPQGYLNFMDEISRKIAKGLKQEDGEN